MLAAFEKSDRKALGDFATAQLIAKKLSVLILTTEAGQVIARGEDRDRVGDSLSGDSLVKRGLLGDTASTVISKDGVIAPELQSGQCLRSMVKVKQSSVLLWWDGLLIQRLSMV